MVRRGLSVVVLLAFTTYFLSCTSTHRRNAPPTDPQRPREAIVGLTTAAGDEVRFDGYATIDNGTVRGTLKGGARYSVPLTDVSRLWFERTTFSFGKTVLLTVGVVVGTFALLLAMKDSCPFVYAWDGSRFQFDAEPLGGATSFGLQRDELSELEHLKSDANEYRLLVRNEVEETQHLDLLELMVVDHPPATRVVADFSGNLHSVGAAAPPRTARDGAGRDLLPWLRARDGVIWEPRAVRDAREGLRREVILEFDKPAGARSVKLVANVATGMWGGAMIKEMLALRGRELGLFYAALDSDPSAVKGLEEWNLREELYVVKVDVAVGSSWATRGLVHGGGPLLSEDRVVMLNVSDVPGDRVRIRLRPPAGFWAFNAFGLDATPDTQLSVAHVAPSQAIDNEGRDLQSVLSAPDGATYDQPEMGDEARLTFHAPPAVPNRERTIFLHTRGWYRIHIDDIGEPNREILRRISDIPDGAATFAADRFAAWSKQATSSSPVLR